MRLTLMTGRPRGLVSLVLVMAIVGLAAAVGLTPAYGTSGMTPQGNRGTKVMKSVNIQPAKSPQGVNIPPLDAQVPPRTDTATFGLG
jgi:hypothetical protein